MSVFGVVLVLLVSKIVWNLCEIEYGVIVVIVGKKWERFELGFLLCYYFVVYNCVLFFLMKSME